MNKVYILQKDLPDYKAGEPFEFDGSYYRAKNPCEDNVHGQWPPNYVENNPEWFTPEETKSNDSFQWTREFIEEMIWEEWGHKDVRAVIDKWERDNPQMNTPKPQAEGELLTHKYLAEQEADAHKAELRKYLDPYPPQAKNKPQPQKEEQRAVLFTTEDGWPVLSGDCYELYGVAIQGTNNDTIWKRRVPFGRDRLHTNRKWFYSKEKAEEYVLMNKPLVSLNDILSVWDKDNLKSPRYYMDAPVFLRIKELAKSKNSKQ